MENKLNISLAILAGGLATRLHPISTTLPKALMDVAGKPFIFHQLDLLQKSGISQVVICAGHLGEQIKQILPDGRQWDIKLEFSFDGSELLGTGGAVRKALDLLSDPFFVMYGDSYLPIDFRELVSALPQDKDGLMTVFRNRGKWDRSNVIFRNGSLIVYDKRNHLPEMEYIEYGISLLRKSAFAAINEKKFDLADLFTKLVRAKRMAALEIRTRFYEIGSPEGLAELRDFLSERNRKT